jgi:hypothetical protein
MGEVTALPASTSREAKMPANRRRPLLNVGSKKMIDYAKIDPILAEWAKDHGLHIFTQYKDEEVRAIDVVDDAGNIYGVYVAPPDQDGKIKVNASGRGKKAPSASRTATVANLSQVLEATYQEIEDWIHSRGNTRTPVK